MKLPQELVSVSHRFSSSLKLMGIIAVYYSSTTLAGAFSGFIAYGVQRNLTKTVTGRAPWEWLFIIDGTIAIFIGLLTWLLLPRFADQITGKHWLLRKEEIDLAVERLKSEFYAPSKIMPL